MQQDGTFREKANAAIQQFIERNLNQGDIYHDLDFLRAVVLGGDASPQAIQILQKILADVLPHHSHLLKAQLDPSRLGAVGAAMWAMEQVEHPEILEDRFPGYYIYQHDEL